MSSSSFELALQNNPAPPTRGDVRLRYEPSLLIGETERPRRTWRPTLAWLVGISCSLSALGALVLQPSDFVTGALLGASIIGLGGATWLERRDRRRRAFIINFVTDTLRLDFVTPLAGKPRTMLVHFDGVRAVTLFPQADQRACLTVDFVPAPDSRELLREVLAANIPEAQADDAARLHRVLEGAFGLGGTPADLTAPHDRRV